MALGKKIKEERNKKGFTQEKIAELVGVSRQAVTKWESGQSTPSMENLITLAGIFEVSLGELTGGVDDSIPIANTNNSQDKSEKMKSKGTIKLVFAIILFVIGVMVVAIFSNMNSVDISRLTGVWVQSARLVRLGIQIGGSMAILAAIVLFVLYAKGRKTTNLSKENGNDKQYDN